MKTDNSLTAQDCDINAVRHRGIIQRIDKENYHVLIVVRSACSACHSKGICPVGEAKEQIIEVPKGGLDDFKVGDEVDITMGKSSGNKAVLLGYGLPFILLLGSLLGGVKILGNQGLAGLLTIGILLVYYSVLYFFRKRLKKTFTFHLHSR